MALGNGKVVYQFGAVDCFTRKRVAALASRLTSHHGAEFLKQVVAQFPFQVQAIQPDGGSKFLKEFGAAIAELRLTHYFNRPNYPQSLPRTGYGGNGRIERSLRTYGTAPPHQAPGYKTPEQFYQHWLNTNSTRKEVLCDMT